MPDADLAEFQREIFGYAERIKAKRDRYLDLAEEAKLAKKSWENECEEEQVFVLRWREEFPLFDRAKGKADEAPAGPDPEPWRPVIVADLPIRRELVDALVGAGFRTLGDMADHEDSLFENVDFEKFNVSDDDADAIWNAFDARKAEVLARFAAKEAPPDEDDDSWRATPLEVLGLPVSIHAALREAGLLTLGAIADWTASDRRLTDIPRVGPAKAQRIEDALERFWADRAPGARPLPPASSEEPEPFEAADAVAEAVADDGSAPRAPARGPGWPREASPLLTT